jgi:hypothetical protein
MQRKNSLRHLTQLARYVAFITVALSLVLTLSYCNKDKPEVISIEEVEQDLSLETAKSALPRYYNLIKSLTDRGFEFMNFKDFIATPSELLPTKLIVLRHDIHHRDIVPGYYSQVIEDELIGNDAATYFVMFFYSDEYQNHAVQDDYLQIIAYLKQKQIDVQAHVSPTDWFIAGNQPDWLLMEEDELKAKFDENYEMIRTEDGLEVNVINEDFMDLAYMNSEFERLIKKYRLRWFEYTGDSVDAFAAHGSAVKLNKVFNNSWVLDQKMLLEKKLYEYDAYNSSIMAKLKYISDNRQPEWMDNPELIDSGRYELLMHPNVWFEGEQEEKFAEAEQRADDCAIHVDAYSNTSL